MTTQESLASFDPLKLGLYRRMVDQAGTIDNGQWLRAKATSEFVGECRACGGYLRPETPYEHHNTKWYEATCVNCDKPIAAPQGHTVRRSSRHSEMPHGWWDWRNNYLRTEAKQGGH